MLTPQVPENRRAKTLHNPPETTRHGRLCCILPLITFVYSVDALTRRFPPGNFWFKPPEIRRVDVRIPNSKPPEIRRAVTLHPAPG